MKFGLPKNRLTGGHWDLLTIVFASLAGMVCIIYAVIFAHPEVLPAPLQVPTQTPALTSSDTSAVPATQPFPTFPAEWTAVFATRHAQSPRDTPTALVSPAGVGASPVPSATVVLATDLSVSPVPTLTTSLATTATLMPLTPGPTLSSPIAPEATATQAPANTTPVPSPATPLPPTSTVDSSTGYPGEVPSETPLPPGYPSNQ